MKTTFKNVDKIITRRISEYTCPFCNKSLDIFREMENSGGVDCYNCNWRVTKYSILINNKYHKLHSSFPNINSQFQISFDFQSYSNMVYEEDHFDINYFINYYLNYSENLLFI